jgi:MFS family permease
VAAVIDALRGEPLFTRWVLAEGVSMVGTAMSTVVLPVLVYDLTGSAGLAGLVYATRLAPYLLLGLVAGPVADRVNRRWLIIGGNLAEGALAATIPLAAMFDALTVGHVFVVAVLSAVAFVFSDAAVFGAVPALVRPGRLASANGLLATLGSAADIAGPVLAGVLIATIGASNAVWVDAASFGAAALVQMTIASDFRRVMPPRQPPTFRRQIRVAVGFIRQHRTIGVLLVAGFGNSLAVGIVAGLLVPWSIEVLGYGRDDARVGVLYAGIGIGGLVAGAVFPRIFGPDRVRVLTPATLAWSTVACGLLLVVLAPLAVLNVAAFSFGVMLTITIGITYRQLVTPDHLVSTVSTAGRMVAAGGQPLGAALGAATATALSVSTAYVVATAVLAATAVGALVALRACDTAVEPGAVPVGAAE